MPQNNFDSFFWRQNPCWVSSFVCKNLLVTDYSTEPAAGGRLHNMPRSSSMYKADIYFTKKVDEINLKI